MRGPSVRRKKSTASRASVRRDSISKRRGGALDSPAVGGSFGDENVEKAAPDDQLDLNDAELEQEMTRLLTSADPDSVDTVSEFNYDKGEYIKRNPGDNVKVLFEMQSLLECKHTDTIDEDQDETAANNTEEDAKTDDASDTNNDESPGDGATAAAGGDGTDATTADGTNAAADGTDESPTDEATGAESEQTPNEDEEVNDDDQVSSEIKTAEKKVKNEFNFSERASQTLERSTRERSVMTEPPPTSIFTQQVSKHVIFDEYYQNLIRLRQSRESMTTGQLSSNSNNQSSNNNHNSSNNKNKSSSSSSSLSASQSNNHNSNNKMDQSTTEPLQSSAMKRMVEVMERVVGQNADVERFMELRKRVSLVTAITPALVSPLWSFEFAPYCRDKMVTSLCWNPLHSDLFAVGYGSYDFHKQTRGVICVYSLKRNGFPQRVITLDSGVMSLDFDRTRPSLICVGTYDGSVAVYDVSRGNDTVNEVLYARTGDHSDSVWAVQWYCALSLDDPCSSLSGSFSSSAAAGGDASATKDGPASSAGGANNNGNSDGKSGNEFISASSDCTVRRYQMSQASNELLSEVALDLGAKEVMCCAMDRHPFNPHLLLLGTETGRIVEMNLAVASQTGGAYESSCVSDFRGHCMQVYAVRWNRFDSECFASCSEDWTLKLWDSKSGDEIISYDLGSPVGDVCWAPFSATIFAACTTDGRVHIFDLKQDKNQPIHTERVIKSSSLRYGLTHVSFAQREPILLIGDERGKTSCLKVYFKHYDPTQSIIAEDERAKLKAILNVTGSKVLDLSKKTAPVSALK